MCVPEETINLKLFEIWVSHTDLYTSVFETGKCVHP